MRWMISDSSLMPLNADWINETPLDELLIAVLMLLSWESILDETVLPAASSAAEFTRSPDDNLVMDCWVAVLALFA
jgi:hypothetical protein